MDADANTYRSIGTLHGSCSSDRVRGTRERHEEGITLGIDLHPTVGGERFTQSATVGAQRPRIAAGAQLLQELRRPFNIGEEEGDGSGREIARHRTHDAPEKNRSLA